MLFLPIASDQLQQGQKIYDDFQQKLSAAKSVRVTFVSMDGNAWTHEHTYWYAKPRFFSATGALNFVTDGVRTASNSDLGSFNCPASPEDVRTLEGFEGLTKAGPRLRVSKAEPKVLLGNRKALGLWFDVKPRPYWLYLDPGTGYPVEFQDGDERVPPVAYDVALDAKPDRSLFHVDHPINTRTVIFNLRTALQSPAPVLCRVSKAGYKEGVDRGLNVSRLKDLLQDFPWTTVLRSNKLTKMSEPTVYNLSFCYTLTVRRDKQVITCYIDSHDWLPVGYSITLPNVKKGDFFRYDYRASNGAPLRESTSEK